MNELLPCPFCGGEAHVHTTNKYATGITCGFTYIIECSECGCTPIEKPKNMNVWLDKSGVVQVESAGETVFNEMVKVWNTRVKGDN